MLTVLYIFLNFFQTVEVVCNWRPVSELFDVHDALIDMRMIFVGIIDDPQNQPLTRNSAFDFIVLLTQVKVTDRLFVFICLLHLFLSTNQIIILKLYSVDHSK